MIATPAETPLGPARDISQGVAKLNMLARWLRLIPPVCPGNEDKLDCCGRW